MRGSEFVEVLAGVGTSRVQDLFDQAKKAVPSIIDEEVNRIAKWAYDRAISLLTSHRETLDCIARSLRLHETLDARQLRAIMEDINVVHTGPL